LAEGVCLERGGRRVLKDVSTAIERAQVTAVVGPSGSGKSSLLRCFNRLEEPQEGRVLLAGEDTRQIAPVELRRRVGLIAQMPTIFPGGVRANLAYGLDDPEDFDLRTTLESVGLPGHFLERPSDALSGGEAQRLCIARALVRNPEVLLLDEPTASLDRDAVRTIERLIWDLAGRGLTIVIVTHDLGQAGRVTSHVKLMVDGRLTAEGDVGDVEQAWPKEER
jgi:putative ABC transport system ATP-binding protein